MQSGKGHLRSCIQGEEKRWVSLMSCRPPARQPAPLPASLSQIHLNDSSRFSPFQEGQAYCCIFMQTIWRYVYWLAIVTGALRSLVWYAFVFSNMYYLIYDTEVAHWSDLADAYRLMTFTYLCYYSYFLCTWISVRFWRNDYLSKNITVLKSSPIVFCFYTDEHLKLRLLNIYRLYLFNYN